VPFGPRVSQTGVVDLEPPAPVRPDDFWGEDSASIHDVLQAPDAVEPSSILVEVGAPPAPRARRSFVSRARGRFRGRGSVRGQPLVLRRPRLAVPPVPRLARGRTARLGRARVVSLIAAGVVALAYSTIALTTLGASPLRGSQRGAARADQTVAHLSPAALAIDPAIRWRPPRRHATARHRAPAVDHVPASSGASRGGSATPAPTRVSDSQPGTGYAQPASTPSTTAGASAAPASGGGSGGGTVAGPQGPGAAFGPGHLG
jgi:hypothetical protein